MKRAQEIAAGLFSVSAVALNVVWHVQHERWFESFWLCNLSLGLVGLGLFSRSQLAVNVGFVWLVPGTLAWASEAAFLGGSFAPTSYLVHLTGSALAVFAVARFGVHRRTELAALAFLGAVLLLARCLPAAANVNCAFGARSGWSLLPKDASLFFGCGALVALVTSFLSTWLARGIASRTRSQGSGSGNSGSKPLPAYGAGLAPP